MNHSRIFFAFSLLALVLPVCLFVSFSHAEMPTTNTSSVSPSVSPSDPEVVVKPFATVGDVVISAEIYVNALRQGIRQKFYHGNVPEGELAKFQRKVGSGLVERVLLLKEAKRQGIKPDMGEIAKTIAEYDKRYANSPRWRANREKMLASVTPELEIQSILTQVENSARTISEPKIAEVQAFYAAHPDKFTEPMDQQVSLILLKVDPSSSGAVWDQAREEAKKLIEKLRNGADFVELAQIHSGDSSADAGGRLGNTHKGTLSEEIEKALEKIKPGEVTDPVTILEGIAVLRLESRTLPRKVSFEDAKERAKGLLMREQSESTWVYFKKQLWKNGKVSINEVEYYLPLTPSGEEKAKEGLQGKNAIQEKTMR